MRLLTFLSYIYFEHFNMGQKAKFLNKKKFLAILKIFGSNQNILILAQIFFELIEGQDIKSWLQKGFYPIAHCATIYEKKRQIMLTVFM